MPNHDFTRAGGIWTDGPVLTAELADFDDKSTHSLDDRGGTYALEADYEIGGDPGVDWTFAIPVIFEDDVTAEQLTVNGFADFVASASFQQDVQVFGDLDVFTDLDVNGTTTLDGEVTVNAFAEFTDFALFGEQVNFDGDVVVAGETFLADTLHADGIAIFDDFTQFNALATFSGSANLGSASTFTGTLTGNSGGRLVARRTHRQAIGGDANASYAVTSYDHVRIQAGTLSAARTYTIDDTGAVDGDRMHFSTFDSGFAVSIHKPGAVQIAQIKGDTRFGCDVERIAGVWALVNYSNSII